MLRILRQQRLENMFQEFRPDQDRNEEPKKVFTLNMTFENESDWLDMQEIIEQWDIGWLKGVHRSQAETTNDVIESIQNGTAKPTSWRFMVIHTIIFHKKI